MKAAIHHLVDATRAAPMMKCNDEAPDTLTTQNLDTTEQVGHFKA